LHKNFLTSYMLSDIICTYEVKKGEMNGFKH